jgi:hypothetical protein
MLKLTKELKKVKKEVQDIRAGTLEFYNENLVKRRGIEDYKQLHQVKTGKRETLDKVMFDFKA